jgi:hypothetical protein
LHDLHLYLDACGKEEDERKYDGDDYCHLYVLVLLGFDVLQDGQLHGAHLRVEAKDERKYCHLYARLYDSQQDYGPEDHEQKDGIEEQHLEIFLAVNDSKGDPIVADYSVVDQHDSNKQDLHRNSKCGHVDHPDLDDIKCAFDWLYCLAERVSIDPL